ncbi:RES family NAD+ phosphorylase [Rhizobium sp. PL01]|uniref:RES family NAD+ phosphorylase n=1 Tax=Rhizobium sp. PL01 TaxID=3085631 RepID=UPI002982188F|nr:RES domain-containing protein [Rhizobium sp. PL01]MDW5316251.1 RES domain-containing protein [Rhizobium sp. PL01]
MPDKVRKTLTLWRAFVPQWAFAPLSGEGAARFGGRWNPVGAATIYAARELSTAWAEYNQGFVQHPALIAQLELKDAALADLTDPAVLSGLAVSDDIHLCEWRMLLDERKVPPAHQLRQRLLEDGFDGVVYPSFMSPGGSCVALWRWNAKGAPRLDAVDPDGRLPKTPASWL